MAAPATANTSALFTFDLEACGCSGEIAGCDEVGRGCLAGPIVAAAVVFDYSTLDLEKAGPPLKGLGDSKKLSPAARERLYPVIIRHASRVSITSYTSRTIDEKGLHKTNLRALARSLETLAPCPETALVDGHLPLPDCPVVHRPVKKGDSRSACIAAASIIAKVTRDRLMRTLHHRYPEYGFDQHVGYSTPAHREAIARHGYCSIHRRSFRCELPVLEES